MWGGWSRVGEVLPVLERELSVLSWGSFPKSDQLWRQRESRVLWTVVSYYPSRGCFDGNLFICFPGSPVILHSSALLCLPPSLPPPLSINDQISLLRAETQWI